MSFFTNKEWTVSKYKDLEQDFEDNILDYFYKEAPEQDRWRYKCALDFYEEARCLQDIVDIKQDKINALMFEYCPEEMTPEQRNEWERYQVPVPEGVEWHVLDNGKRIASNDYSDVVLYVAGEFESHEQKLSYAQNIANMLNSKHKD